MGCSQGPANEQSENEDKKLFTNEEIDNFVEDNNIEMLALLNNADNNFATILGENAIYQIDKGNNGGISSNTQELTGNKDVKFGTNSSTIYVVINDEELLEKGHMLKVVFKDGEFASELFRSERNPYVAFYDYGKMIDELVGDVDLFIYDSMGNKIYEDSIQEKESQAREPEKEIQNDGVASKTEKQNDDEDSEFHTEIPSIKKKSLDGLNITFDNLYEEVCWNDCDDNRTYNYYPDIHSGDVEVGDSILIDWRTMKPTPSEVNLIHVNSSGEEISKENINTDSSTLNLQIGEEEMGNQYAVQFLWKDGEKHKGHSVLNFKLN